ncbi:MAG: HesB/IscA family protein [Bdellovibrionales bacterium]
MEMKLSDSAASRINDLTSSGAFAGQMLRIAVNPGGCSGFEYQFSFTDDMQSGDHIFEHNGAKLVIDDMSLDLLKGSTLDYESGLMGAMFKVINPNAQGGCGCGNSFSA